MVDEKTVHIMLRPSQNLHNATDDQTTYIANAFETILADGGRYREVFADPLWVSSGPTSPMIAKVPTTTSGQGLLFPRI